MRRPKPAATRDDDCVCARRSPASSSRRRRRPRRLVRLPAFYGYAALNGLSISAAYALAAPKHARGAEISMVLLLEVVLGPIWMFLGYGDRPAVFTLVGGALLLLVLFLHELAALRDWLSDWRSCVTGSRERTSADGPVLTETK